MFKTEILRLKNSVRQPTDKSLFVTSNCEHPLQCSSKLCCIFPGCLSFYGCYKKVCINCGWDVIVKPPVLL